MFVIRDENLQKLFIDLDRMLSLVEVKGDSVQHLFTARNMINEFYKKIEEEEDEKAKEG